MNFQPKFPTTFQSSLPICLIESKHIRYSKMVKNSMLAGLRHNGFKNIDVYECIETFVNRIARDNTQPECIYVEYDPKTPYVLEVLRDIRQNKTSLSPFIKIVVITETREVSDLERIIYSGVDDIVIFPISFGTLARRLSETVPRTKDFILSFKYVGPDHPATRAHANWSVSRIPGHNGADLFMARGFHCPAPASILKKIDSAVTVNTAGIDLLSIAADMKYVHRTCEDTDTLLDNMTNVFRALYRLKTRLAEARHAVSKTRLETLGDLLHASAVMLDRFSPNKNLCYNYKEIQVFDLVGDALERLYVDSTADNATTRAIVTLIETRFMEDRLFDARSQWKLDRMRVAPPAVTTQTTAGPASDTPPGSSNPILVAHQRQSISPHKAYINSLFRDALTAEGQRRRFVAFFAAMIEVQFAKFRDPEGNDHPYFMAEHFSDELQALFKAVIARDMMKSRVVQLWMDSALRDGFKPMELIAELCVGDQRAIQQAWQLGLENCLKSGSLRKKFVAAKDRFPTVHANFGKDFIRTTTEILFFDPEAVSRVETSVTQAKQRIEDREIPYWGLLNTIMRGRDTLPRHGASLLMKKVLHAVFEPETADRVCSCLSRGDGPCPVLNCTERRMIPKACERPLDAADPALVCAPMPEEPRPPLISSL